MPNARLFILDMKICIMALHKIWLEMIKKCSTLVLKSQQASGMSERIFCPRSFTMQTDRREQGEVIKIFIKWHITLIYFVEKKHLFHTKISATMFNVHVQWACSLGVCKMRNGYLRMADADGKNRMGKFGWENAERKVRTEKKV